MVGLMHGKRFYTTKTDEEVEKTIVRRKMRKEKRRGGAGDKGRDEDEGEGRRRME